MAERAPASRSHVVRLDRYPVKGFGPQTLDRLTVLESRVVGDRVLGFRYADAEETGDGWGTKRQMVVLMNTPSIARLTVHTDGDRIRLLRGDELIADEPLDAAGRQRVAALLADQPEVDLPADSPHRPLRVVGDGRTPQLQDREPGYVTLHSRASIEAFAEATGGEVDQVRFRSNVIIDGVEPLAELGWAGRQIAIGGMRFRVHQPLVRCLATHANPSTGERDLNVLRTLTRGLDLPEPIFGVSLVALADGELTLGDDVTLID
ncbi:MOSC domain-containing protein [Enemella evansiae]|uniref:MOSC domain-containing protein n=1 Tax=Enemella evansiae TaxID=2016499 RepID=UPI000B969113|nr:MOSC domain-containing protein [Enemella evansiae]OYO18996.1 MOSC domain-containing protein [Enemella evansiae]TDO86259.1 hypothetical protein C8D81_3634 [Enemella evansiae]